MSFGDWFSAELQKIPNPTRALVCALILPLVIGLFNKKAGIAVLVVIIITWLGLLARKQNGVSTQ